MGIFIGRELGRERERERERERDGRDSLNVKVRYGYIYREGARKRERWTRLTQREG